MQNWKVSVQRHHQSSLASGFTHSGECVDVETQIASKTFHLRGESQNQKRANHGEDEHGLSSESSELHRAPSVVTPLMFEY